MTMTRETYIGHLRALYLAANNSDADELDYDGTPLKPEWMKGDECSAHCCPLDLIARHMNLGEDWLSEPTHCKPVNVHAPGFSP